MLNISFLQILFLIFLLFFLFGDLKTFQLNMLKLKNFFEKTKNS